MRNNNKLYKEMFIFPKHIWVQNPTQENTHNFRAEQTQKYTLDC